MTPMQHGTEGADAPADTTRAPDGHDDHGIDPLVRYLARCALRTRALLHDTPSPQLGNITLLPHQVTAVRWLMPRIRRFGGALLADPPGLGKTYVALAVAKEFACRPLVIAPAALRSRWTDAARTTGIPLDFVSTERLSAPATPHLAAHPLVIIDEAHHLRTPSTRRHHRTTKLCANAKVLLLSATPIHNSTDDLLHVTRLFHTPATHASTSSARHLLTLRRTVADIHAARLSDATALVIPVVRHRAPITMPPRVTSLPADIMAIPPLRTNERDGHSLLQLGLLHALRSSDAAARAHIRHRIAATIGMEQAARAHIQPTRDVRRAWRSSEADVQLAMPELLGRPCSTVPPHLAADAATQRLALEALLPALTGIDDRRRCTALRRLARWSTRPVVAFTQFSATAEQFFRDLRTQPGIALLTGNEARLVSGTISRADVLQRLLDPHHRHRHDVVRLLITTDVLSEGLSLSGVATIVHLDLPWTAARLDQRIGRAARIGAPVTEVQTVSLPAPLPEAAYAAITTLLARKRRFMGALDPHDDTGAQIIELLVALARRVSAQPPAGKGWVTMRSRDIAHHTCLAIVRLRARTMLLASDERGLRAPCIADWQALAAAQPTEPEAGQIAALRRRLTSWQAERELTESVTDLHDARLLSRQAADAALQFTDRSMRARHATETSAHRRSIMNPSPRAGLHASRRDRTDGAVRAGRTGDAVPANRTDDAVHAERAPLDARIRIRCGIALIPMRKTEPRDADGYVC